MRKKPTFLSKVYSLQVEEPNDYYFKPEGVVFVDEKGNYTLYAADSRHNFLRSILQKFPERDLEQGVSFKEHQVKAVDLTDLYEPYFEMIVDEILSILHRVYKSSPRQYFFLEKFFDPKRVNQQFVP
ncbi:MAG TPA: hypothetical protein VFV52_15770 [Bacilli bacterium]|nr:hypothetical protein [Bacilli bacterium]